MFFLFLLGSSHTLCMEAQLSAAQSIKGYCKTTEDKSRESAKNPSETTSVTIPEMPDVVKMSSQDFKKSLIQIQ